MSSNQDCVGPALPPPYTVLSCARRAFGYYVRYEIEEGLATAVKLRLRTLRRCSSSATRPLREFGALYSRAPRTCAIMGRPVRSRSLSVVDAETDDTFVVGTCNEGVWEECALEEASLELRLRLICELG